MTLKNCHDERKFAMKRDTDGNKEDGGELPQSLSWFYIGAYLSACEEPKIPIIGV